MEGNGDGTETLTGGEGGVEYVYGGGRDYWNARYEQPKFARHRDWYCDYAVLRSHADAVFGPCLPLPASSSSPSSNLRLLVVGCGNSTLSQGLYEDGHTDITNIDISDVVIRQVKEEHGERYPRMTYAVMDATQMDFEDDSFDLVLDKGTLDAVCCAQECFGMVHRMFNEILRVLRVGGQYICISYGPPYLRRPYFLKDRLKHQWRLEERRIELVREEQIKCLSVLEDDESGVFHVYICTKLDATEVQQREEAYLQDNQSRRCKKNDNEQEESANHMETNVTEGDAEDDEDEDGDETGELLDAVDFFENPFYKKNP